MQVRSGILSLAAAGLLALPVAVQAQDLIDGSDPERIASVLRGFGSARVEADSSGKSVIVARAEGKAYRVHFYGCTDGANCTSIGFWAYWSQSAPLEKINAWNAGKRYGKVYLDDDGEVVLEYDLNLTGGVPTRNLDVDGEIWLNLMAEVEKDLGFR